MDHYDPLGPKWAEVAVVDTSSFPVKPVLADKMENGTGLEDILLSEDGRTLVAIAAIDPKGRINSSEVRVYDVAGARYRGGVVTGYVYASCLSADGRWLVLATCDSENAIEVYNLADGERIVQTINSSYPKLPGTFTYAAQCAVSNAGSLWVAWPLWWGSSINSSAVAFYATLPSSPAPAGAYLAPTTMYQSPAISPTLQDTIAQSVYLEGTCVNGGGCTPGLFA